MATSIKCPNCATELNVENMLSADAEEKLKRQYEQQLLQSLTRRDKEKKKLADEQRLLEEQKQQQDELFNQRLLQEKQRLELQLNVDRKKLQIDLQQELRKSIGQDYENQLRILKESDIEKEEKLRAAQQKQLEYLRREKELKDREREL